MEEFIDGLPTELRAKVRNHLRLLREFGTGLRRPHARALAGHSPLWELRPLPVCLIYFAFGDRRLLLLHGFWKKGKRTPRRHISTAERRMADFLERNQ